MVGRYGLPFGVGVSGSWKVQAGQQYGRTVSVRFPGDSTQTVRVEPITTNRFPTVAILDFQLRHGHWPADDDREVQEVTAILDPRIVEPRIMQFG